MLLHVFCFYYVFLCNRDLASGYSATQPFLVLSRNALPQTAVCEEERSGELVYPLIVSLRSKRFCAV